MVLQGWTSSRGIVEKTWTSIPGKWIKWEDQNKWFGLEKMVTTETFRFSKWKTRRVQLVSVTSKKRNKPSAA